MVGQLRALIKRALVTLLDGTRDNEHNNTVVLANYRRSAGHEKFFRKIA